VEEENYPKAKESHWMAKRAATDEFRFDNRSCINLPHAFCDADKVMFIKHYGQNQRLWITKKWIVST